MMLAGTSKERTVALLATGAALCGVVVGLANLIGPLAVGALALCAAGVALVLLNRAFYRALVALAAVLLACVFVEPSPSDVLFAAAIALGLLCGAISWKTAQPIWPFLCLLLAYFIVSIPGIAAAPDAPGALRYYVITCYLFLLAVFLCLYAQANTAGLLLKAYLVAAFVSLLAGVAGMCGIFPELLMADAFRVKGLFKDANVFGPFFVPAVILLMEDFRNRTVWNGSKALNGIGIVLLCAGAFVSYSRAAWINLAVSIAIYLALHIRHVRLSRLAYVGVSILMVAALAVLLLTLGGAQNDKTVGFFLERAKIQDYDSNRFSAQSAGLYLASQNPAFGVGPGQFENCVDDVTGMRLSSHNLYIRIAAENGALAFLFFFLAVGGVLVGLLLLHRRQGKALLPATGPGGCSPALCIAVLGGILVNSLVVDTLHWRHLWFFLGLSLYLLGKGRGREWNHA